MRILLAIGCNTYDRVAPLTGAEFDAERVFGILTGSSGEYDPTASRLLRSPTIAEVRAALDQLYGYCPIDVLTVFFAGHGEVKNGTFFALVRDSDPSRYSVTALSCDRLLEAVGELALNGAQPTQVNIILDACQSGGAMFDMGSILKREMLGQATSFGVSFLAACADYQYAGETHSGGIATTALVACLTGEREIQRTRPYLDLVEIGRPLSSEVSAAHADQVPATWGLNLFGESRFAKNPYYSAQPHAPSLPVSQLPPAGAVGMVLERHADVLWSEYASLSQEADCPRLVQLFTSVGDALVESGAPVLPFLRGVATSFATRARVSNDLAAESCVIASAAVATLRYPAESGIRTLATSLLGEWIHATQVARAEILEAINGRPNALIGLAGFAELHYLPIRLSRLLGWFGSECLVRRLLGQPVAETDRVLEWLETLVNHILDTYGGACAAVSVAQAAPLYVFAKSVASERPKLAMDVLDTFFNSFVQTEGAVLKPYASHEEVFEFTLCRAYGLSGKECPPELIDRPSGLLWALLASGMTLAGDAWDVMFRRLDHHYLSTFVPGSYGDFASGRIEEGMNYTARVGHDIWTLRDFRAYFESHVRSALTAAAPRTALDQALAVLASMVLPDRLPLFLEIEGSLPDPVATGGSSAT